jgi:hypothetical protein
MRLLIILLLITGIAQAQSKDVTFGIKSTLDADTNSTTIAPSMLLFTQMMNANKTTVYKDNSLGGIGTVSDPLRVNINAFFTQRKLAEVKATHPPFGQFVWLTDNKLLIFWDGSTMRYINSIPFK